MSSVDSIAAASRASISAWVAAARPRTLTAAVLPVIVGIALAHRTGPVNEPLALVTLAAAALIQIGTNLANDYYDFVAGADTEARLGPIRVTQAKLIEPTTVRNAAFAMLGLAVAAGCYLVRAGGWPILIIGVLSVVSAIGYTAGPYPLAYNGLGDLFVFIFFGLAAVNGTAFLQTGTVTLLSLAASAPIACLATAILVVNNLRDIETDRSAGKRTLAVRFGSAFARTEYTALVITALLAAPVLALIGGPMFLLPLASILIALRAIRGVQHGTGAVLNRELARTAALHSIFGALLAVAIVL
ncbi:MAG TPA: 1,4-dihydroxy-2-naphthoate polyprenyltransferase [Candidatus Binataceae bacterium]|nr:1,4-dihydroxy-2-naphthoate polyprenyltransferase [Candidatus Binataceae bacterium]